MINKQASSPISSVDRAVGFEPTSGGSSTLSWGTNGTRLCKTCNTIRGINEYSIKNREKGTYQSWCKYCQRVRSKAHYEANKKAYRSRNLRRMAEVVSFVDIFKNQPCADCGVKYPSKVMDLHHLDGEEKEEAISIMSRKTTLPKIKRELAKCIVLCSNCHRIRTHYPDRFDS